MINVLVLILHHVWWICLFNSFYKKLLQWWHEFPLNKTCINAKCLVLNASKQVFAKHTHTHTCFLTCRPPCCQGSDSRVLWVRHCWWSRTAEAQIKIWIEVSMKLHSNQTLSYFPMMILRSGPFPKKSSGACLFRLGRMGLVSAGLRETKDLIHRFIQNFKNSSDQNCKLMRDEQKIFSSK